MTSAAPLNILIAEDEAMIAMLLEDFLLGIGHSARWQCATNVECESTLSSESAIDLAILDCNLADGPVWPTARALRDRGIKILFASGNGDHGIPTDLTDVPVLGKPYSIASLEQALSDIIEKS